MALLCGPADLRLIAGYDVIWNDRLREAGDGASNQTLAGLEAILANQSLFDEDDAKADLDGI